MPIPSTFSDVPSLRHRIRQIAPCMTVLVYTLPVALGRSTTNCVVTSWRAFDLFTGWPTLRPAWIAQSVLRTCTGHLRDGVSCAWVNHIQLATRLGLNPLIVDEQLQCGTTIAASGKAQHRRSKEQPKHTCPLTASRALNASFSLSLVLRPQHNCKPSKHTLSNTRSIQSHPERSLSSFTLTISSAHGMMHYISTEAHQSSGEAGARSCAGFVLFMVKYV